MIYNIVWYNISRLSEWAPPDVWNEPVLKDRIVNKSNHEKSWMIMINKDYDDDNDDGDLALKSCLTTPFSSLRRQRKFIALICVKKPHWDSACQ